MKRGLQMFSRRIISVILSLCLVLSSLFTVPASAADTDDGSGGVFRCAWFDETLVYPYTYSDSLFDASPYSYNHDLAVFSLELAMASFNSFDKEHRDEHITDMLTECGYAVTTYGYDTGDYDTIGLAVGSRKMNGFTAVLAVVRSGNYGMEWGGNMHIGSGDGNHEGFDIGKSLVLGYLNDWFEVNRPRGKIKLLIPGYSRGASVANLAAGELDSGKYKESLGDRTDYIDMENNIDLFCYTFEAPQCTTDKTAHDKIYNNIFNVINPNDYVPLFVMSDWGFTHYGVRVELPTADNSDTYGDYYNNVYREFDSYMYKNGKKASSCFYDEEDSRSCETTLNYILTGLADDVMISREYYFEHYERPLIFYAGQYLSQNRKFGDFIKTVAMLGIASCVCITPRNIAKIRSDGYRRYLAEYLAENNRAGFLTDEDNKNTIDLIISLLDFLSSHTKDVSSLFSQLKTVLNVHQPYVTLAWMRSLTEQDVRCINLNIDSGLRLNCTSLTLKYDTNGRLIAYYLPSAGTVTYKSSAPAIVTVDDTGTFHTLYKGHATIIATLTAPDGKVISTASVEVYVKMSLFRQFIYAVGFR